MDDRKPPAKRLKTGGTGNGDAEAAVDADGDGAPVRESSPVPELVEDALATVMSFLGARALFNMAFTSKSLRAKVSTPMVVRCGMMEGGNVGITMKFMYELMENKSIHAPSALRLLRLINGKRCEFCVSAKATRVRKHYGVFACAGCLDQTDGNQHDWENSSFIAPGELVTDFQYGTNVYGNRQYAPERSAIFGPILHHPRIAVSVNERQFRAYVWTKPTSTKSDERLGPLICYQDIIDIARQLEGSMNIDAYIQGVLRVPPAEEYVQFTKAYRATKERAEQEERARAEKKMAAKQKAEENTRAYIEKTRVKLDKIISDLRTLLDDPFKESALKREDLDVRKRGSPLVRFSSGYVDYLMAPYTSSPSKMTKKSLKRIANEINEASSPFDEYRAL